MKIIEVNNLNKKYHHHIIFENVSYKFEKGKCYMLIGQNGSGKSTFIKCLLGLTHFQGDIKSETEKIGYVPEKMFLPHHLKVGEFLKDIIELKCNNEINEEMINSYLDRWSILNKKDKRIKTLSKGMMQKLAIIQALITDPDLLIFDEVLNGLDINNQNLLFETIRILKENGKTIIVSSHYPKEYLNVVDVVLEVKKCKIEEIKDEFKTN